jgi:Kef-type K+ transport system membrane component KefB/nucleotide-binding universal stress UspA family protein
MKRASLQYAWLIVAAAVALWITLSKGSQLIAPRDMSGAWELTSPDGTSSELLIEQSGKYAQIVLDSRRYQVELASPPQRTHGRMHFLGARQSVIFDPDGEGWKLRATGEIAGEFEARKLEPADNLPAIAGTGTDAPRLPAMLTLLLQIVAILAVSRLTSLLFRKLGQPNVVGEMVAGIMLGPSLLGWLLPQVHAQLFPPESIPSLSILSSIGVIFFLFLIGLELEPRLLRNRGPAAIFISHASIVLPFVLGAVLTLYLYPRLLNDTPQMNFTAVALFMGAAMSVTAFPVLARILAERNLTRTRLGAIVITCAAVDDVTAWCLLAFVIGIARADGLLPGITTAGWAMLYVLVMLLVVRPQLKRLETLYQRRGRLSQGVVATIVCLMLASAWVSEHIGIHALFGAFLMGAIMPKGTAFVRNLSGKFEDFTVIFLLPIFFAYTGLRTQIGLLTGAALWADALLILLVACIGKFGGSALAGRLTGMGWRESAAVGVLMNTRGLMELVILGIGLQEGVITPAIFAMMVIMAVVTTAIAAPALRLIYPDRLAIEAEEQTGQFTVLVGVGDPESGPALAKVASMIAGPAEMGGRVVAAHLRPPVDREAYRSGLLEHDDQTLRPLVEAARTLDLKLESLSLVSTDVAEDMTAIARAKFADLLLLGRHKPVIGAGVLGGVVHRMLQNSECDVGILVQKSDRPLRKILLACSGQADEAGALRVAQRMARVTDQPISLAAEAGNQIDGSGLRLGRNSKPPTTHLLNSSDLIGSLTTIARDYDLVILPATRTWHLESHLLAFRTEPLVEQLACSLLIVGTGNRVVLGDERTVDPNP